MQQFLRAVHLRRNGLPFLLHILHTAEEMMALTGCVI